MKEISDSLKNIPCLFVVKCLVLGKTTFGKQLFNFRNPDIKEIFKATRLSDVLFQTLPVMINIPSFDYQFENTKELISCSIFAATLNQYFGIGKAEAVEFWQKNKLKLSPSDCASLLVSMVHRPLFFHFDEVKDLPEMFPPKPNEETDAVFYYFWKSLAQVQTCGCFVYVCGRTPVLNFFGTYGGAKGSVGEVECIRLSIFKTNEIKDPVVQLQLVLV